MVKRKKNSGKKKNKGGRPTKYSSLYADQVYRLALLGATDQQMAEIIGVSKRTFDYWKKKHKQFLHSLKRGKEKADAKIAHSLYQRALGYEHKDTYFATHKGQIISKTYIKHYPPDTTACIFWLKNRQRDKWRDKQQREHSGGMTLAQAISELHDD
jgi:DNA-binding XRE family transcriptional regulator